ncbi:MAG: DUF932 domain-containing protein [Stackebrandtia sp.]
MSHKWDSGFSVRKPAWHGLANIVDIHPRDWNQARQWAGLEWDVVERRIPEVDWDAEGRPHFVAGPDGQVAYDTDAKALTRSDTGKRLAYVSNSYEVISMDDFGMIFDSVLDQAGVKYETAGSLDEGRMVWALAYLDEPVRIGGDPSLTMPYLLLLSRHDGSGAAQLIPTSIRVICANTAKAAELQGEGTGAVYAFRHTRNWRDRVDDARQAVTGARRAFDDYKNLAEDLYGLKITPRQLDWFVEAFMPYPPPGTYTDRVRRNVDAARDKLQLLAYEPTNDSIVGTAYGLLQLGLEYLDHVRPYRSQATHFGRSMIRPEKQKQRLCALARQAAHADA